MQRDVVVTLDMQPRSDESQRLSPFYLLPDEVKERQSTCKIACDHAVQ